MSGPAYIGWKHTRAEGERAEVARYIPQARKVLGYAVQEAARNQLLTFKHTKRLADGTVLIGEVVGGQPRMTINVPGIPTERDRVPFEENFVTLPRDTDRPDGLALEYPEVILNASADESWRTLFYDSDVPGYDDFTRRKGTYRYIGTDEAFPEGITHSGNIDWLHEDGYRVSWYGPSSRLFADPYVQPRSQYGAFVFMLGQILLDIDAYEAAAEEADGATGYKWVLGACVRRVEGSLYLYVIQTLLPVVGTSTADIPAFSITASPPLHLANNLVLLCRYAITENPAIQDAMKWSIADNSREILWSQSLADITQPWHFNESGTFASSVGADDGTTYIAYFEEDTLEDAPPAFNWRYTLDVDAAALTTQSVSIAAGSTDPVILATDYIGDDPVHLRVGRMEGNDGAFVLEFDGVQWSLAGAEIAFVDDQIQFTDYRYLLLYANLRDRTLVFLKNVHTGHVVPGTPNGEETNTLQVEIWRRGVLVQTLETYSQLQEPTGLVGNTLVFTRVAGNYQNVYNMVSVLAQKASEGNVAPLFALYGVWMLWLVEDLGDFVDVEFTGALYGRLVWPGSENFGSFGFNFTGSPIPVNIIAGGSLAGFDTNIPDARGMYSIIGCATHEDRTVFSGPGFSGYYSGGAPTGITGEAIHYVDFGTLGELTNVAGPQSRYHPVWMLGMIPEVN